MVEGVIARGGGYLPEGLRLLKEELIIRNYNLESMDKMIGDLNSRNIGKKNKSFKALWILLGTMVIGISLIVVFAYAEMAEELSAVSTGMVFAILSYFWYIKPREDWDLKDKERNFKDKIRGNLKKLKNGYVETDETRVAITINNNQKDDIESCPHCKNKLHNNAQFCSNCGNKID